MRAIVLYWSRVYTELPDSMIVGEVSQFRKHFAELAALHHINLEKIGSQNSLGIGERYHKPLPETYRRLNVYFPKMQWQLLLAFSVKAKNDTLGPDGIALSVLVLGEFSSLRTISGPVLPRTSLAERAETAQHARHYMAEHLARAKVNRALKHYPPKATDKFYQPEDSVLVWRKKLVDSGIGW